MTALSTYEFINPSDAILFDAPSDEVAALAALFVGGGKWGAKRVDNDESVVGLGFAETYGRSINDAFEVLADDVVAACHSFRLKSGERTSMSDWCGFAHSVERRGATA